ncbi:MAG TPA: O-antigen ligase family protein [Verrucomicrobiae bacterium]|nr:O-antigen ligase family protein [Verrucomicrobiae bacterium]
MATKDIIGFALLLFAIPASVIVCCVSPRARDVAFCLMIGLAAIAFKLDMNFFSHFWYRGTTRGFEYSVVDVLAVGVLAGSVLFPRPGEKRWFWPAGFGLMLMYFAYACGNVACADPKIYGLFELSKILRGFVFFLAAAMFVRTERELSLLIVALAGAMCFEGALALKQRLLDGLYRVAGTLDDPNSFSMYLCTVSPVFIAAAASTLPKFVRWFSVLATAAATVSIVLTLSRAGIPIFAFIMLGTAMFCVSWRLTPKKLAGLALVVLTVGALFAKQAYLIEARWSHDSLAKEYEDPNYFESRGYFLRLARVIMDDRFFGVGLNNWSYWVSKKYGAQLGTPYEDYDDLTYVPSKEFLPEFHYAAPAHCLLALTVGELGVPGLLIFTLVWLRWFQMGASFLRPRAPDPARRLGVGILFCVSGIFLQSITEWVYRQEQIFITFHVLLGTLAALYWLKKQKPRREEPGGEFHETFEEEEPEYEPAVA